MVKYQDLQRFIERETEENSGTVKVYFAKHGPALASPHLLVRTLNGLERIHITTMDELANTSHKTLANIRNIGPKSLALALLLRERYRAETGYNRYTNTEKETHTT